MMPYPPALRGFAALSRVRLAAVLSSLVTEYITARMESGRSAGTRDRSGRQQTGDSGWVGGDSARIPGAE